MNTLPFADPGQESEQMDTEETLGALIFEDMENADSAFDRIESHAASASRDINKLATLQSEVRAIAPPDLGIESMTPDEYVRAVSVLNQKRGQANLPRLHAAYAAEDFRSHSTRKERWNAGLEGGILQTLGDLGRKIIEIIKSMGRFISDTLKMLMGVNRVVEKKEEFLAKAYAEKEKVQASIQAQDPAQGQAPEAPHTPVYFDLSAQTLLRIRGQVMSADDIASAWLTTVSSFNQLTSDYTPASGEHDMDLVNDGIQAAIDDETDALEKLVSALVLVAPTGQRTAVNETTESIRSRGEVFGDASIEVILPKEKQDMETVLRALKGYSFRIVPAEPLSQKVRIASCSPAQGSKLMRMLKDTRPACARVTEPMIRKVESYVADVVNQVTELQRQNPGEISAEVYEMVQGMTRYLLVSYGLMQGECQRHLLKAKKEILDYLDQNLKGKDWAQKA